MPRIAMLSCNRTQRFAQAAISAPLIPIGFRIGTLSYERASAESRLSSLQERCWALEESARVARAAAAAADDAAATAAVEHA
eukprot:269750-Chlamydomonas_euryale.AAC.1